MSAAIAGVKPEDILVLYSQFTTDLELEKHIIKLNRRNK